MDENMKQAIRDGTFIGMLVIGIAALTVAILLYRSDTAFLSEAMQATAVVTDKRIDVGRRTNMGGTNRTPESDDYDIGYQWIDYELSPPITWTGRAPFAGDREAFDALVPGESTVRIAWRRTDDGRSVESRLVEDGFTGMPWPLLIIGAGLLLAAPVRLFVLLRAGRVAAR